MRGFLSCAFSLVAAAGGTAQRGSCADVVTCRQSVVVVLIIPPRCNTGGTNLKSVTEIREPITPSHLSKLPLGSKKASRSDLDRLPRSVQRQLIKRYGTLSGAINAGVYILGHKAFVPY